MQGDRAVGCVEGEDVAHPPGTGQPVGLLGQQPRARGDHEDVIAERCPVIKMHAVSCHVDVVHPGLAEDDAGP